MQKKTAVLHVRLTPKQKSRLQMNAKLYAKGNMSKWVIYADETVQRRFLK